MPAGGSSGENFEVLRSAIAVGGKWEFVPPLDFAAIAFVADDGVFAADGIAAFEVGAFEDPMISAVGGEGAASIHELAVAFMVASPEEADSCQGVFRATDEVVTPEGGEEGLALSSLEDGIGFVTLFPASESVSLIFTANLPAAGIATEEGDISTIADKRFEVVTHGSGPVFVVADTDDKTSIFENVRVKFEIAIGGEGERDPLPFGPGDEGLFPVSELAPWWPLERDAVALDLIPTVVSIEAEAAPVIVGVVSVGGELEKDGGWIGGVG